MRISILISLTLTAMALAVGTAHAQGNGGIGTTTPSDTPTQGGSAGGAAGATPDPGGTVELTLSNARPRKAYLLGSPAVFRYAIGGNATRDLEIEVVSKASRQVVATFNRNNVTPKQQHAVSWGGRTNAGAMAAQGEYRFRIVTPDGVAADGSRAEGKPDAAFYANKFPIRGRHTYGDGIGAGRGHRGQDVMANCGTPLVAAHGGKVQAAGYDGSGGGHYIVIDGKQSRYDYVYMHLQRSPRFREGQRVKTGERLGEVGDTGNASACHLHFELWTKPGWYEGGQFSGAVTSNLKRWDRWS